MNGEGASAREVAMQIEPGAVLEGELVLPEGATGLVLFAHGSGSSRHSPRNRFVAGEQERAALADRAPALDACRHAW